MSAVYHGGDLSKATERFGPPPVGWIDLSTGINPWPWPVDPDSLEELNRLPDTGLLGGLRESAAAAYGMTGPDCIAAAPGTQALIQWLPRLRPRGRVAVLSPTYGEHAAAWRLAGHDVTEVPDPPAPDEFDVIVVTRPNNPDGRADDRKQLLALADALSEKHGLLVVDEAFADLDASPSLAADADRGVIALRSFGKFYGLPGLRLGFALTDPETASEITAALGPWPVSSLAAKIGTAALADRDWQAVTRNRLSEAATRLDKILTGSGLEIAGGTDLYRLAKGNDAADIYDKLGGVGIYTRPFPDHPQWLRFGLPGSEADWERLEKAMRS